MQENSNPGLRSPASTLRWPLSLNIGVLFALGVILASWLAAVSLPNSYRLTAFGDVLQVALVLAATLLSSVNFLRDHSRIRIFWLLIFVGMGLWTASDPIWAFYEVWLKRPIPDFPDALLFMKVVPLAAAVAIAPDRRHDASFRAVDLIGISVLMIYSLYLYAFGVYACRLPPGRPTATN